MRAGERLRGRARPRRARRGWGLWLDPAIAQDPIWKEHWAGVAAVVMQVAEDSIVLEADRGEAAAADGEDGSPARATSLDGGAETSAEAPPRERGRVKWFNAEKGYGFLVRPTGEDLFVHHSEVRGDPSSLASKDEVDYEVGEGKRGPAALAVKVL